MRTACTPGRLSALEVFTATIRARACGLFFTWAYSMPGSTMSLVYRAPPVSFTESSALCTFSPTCVAAEMAASDIFQLSLCFCGQLARDVEHGLDDLLVAG